MPRWGTWWFIVTGWQVAGRHKAQLGKWVIPRQFFRRSRGAACTNRVGWGRWVNHLSTPATVMVNVTTKVEHTVTGTGRSPGWRTAFVMPVANNTTVPSSWGCSHCSGSLAQTKGTGSGITAYGENGERMNEKELEPSCVFVTMPSFCHSSRAEKRRRHYICESTDRIVYIRTYFFFHESWRRESYIAIQKNPLMVVEIVVPTN